MGEKKKNLRVKRERHTEREFNVSSTSGVDDTGNWQFNANKIQINFVRVVSNHNQRKVPPVQSKTILNSRSRSGTSTHHHWDLH